MLSKPFHPPPPVHNTGSTILTGSGELAAVIVASRMYGDLPVLCRCLVWLTILACLLIMIAITLIGYFKAGILTQDQISSAVRPVEYKGGAGGRGGGWGVRCFARRRSALCCFFRIRWLWSRVASGRCMLSRRRA